MRLLKSNKVPKLELNKLYKGLNDAASASLIQVRPAIDKVMQKCVGTQYFSLAALRSMGHPYKSRAPGGLNPGVINVQSGNFFRAFSISAPIASGSKVYIYIDNDSEVGEMLLSPYRMIKRPWDRYLMWHLQRSISPMLGPLIAANIKIRWDGND